ncbi:unnamed protein product [Periconia digitata]|uniref:Uncharacterized protein n=1 Tax=Periconia digitata TaxID=1303443 RepID=A0A9W4UPX5_9PLEO|nr:unnamed protein product [Periconia digitata]
MESLPPKEYDPEHLHIFPSSFEVTNEIKLMAEKPDENKEAKFARYVVSLSNMKFASDYEQNRFFNNLPYANYIMDYFGFMYSGTRSDWQETIKKAIRTQKPIDTIYLVVTNFEKAAKYIKVSAKVDTKTLFFSAPSSPHECLKDLELINRACHPELRDEDIEKLDCPSWARGRQSFMKQVHGRYEDLLTELVIEERVQKLHERNRKKLVNTL